MPKRCWSVLFAVSPLLLAACSHAPVVNETRVAMLSPEQLVSVHADEATLAQARQVVATQEQERQKALGLSQSATDEVRGIEADLSDKESELERIRQRLQTAKARVAAAKAQVEWMQARVAYANAEVSRQEALVAQAKFQALVKAKDPSVTGLKAEDFADRVKKAESDVRDALEDANSAQKRYQSLRDEWQAAARSN